MRNVLPTTRCVVGATRSVVANDPVLRLFRRRIKQCGVLTLGAIAALCGLSHGRTRVTGRVATVRVLSH